MTRKASIQLMGQSQTNYMHMVRCPYIIYAYNMFPC